MFLDSLGDTPTLKQERLRLSLTKQALVRAPRTEAGCETVLPKRRAALSEAQERTAASFGRATSVTIRQMFSRGWYDYAKAELHAGRNPGLKKWQSIFCAALIDGGISRASLQLAFQEQLALKPESARVQVSKAVNIFLAGRLVIETHGRLVISPN